MEERLQDMYQVWKLTKLHEGFSLFKQQKVDLKMAAHLPTGETAKAKKTREIKKTTTQASYETLVIQAKLA